MPKTPAGLIRQSARYFLAAEHNRDVPAILAASNAGHYCTERGDGAAADHLHAVSGWLCKQLLKNR